MTTLERCTCGAEAKMVNAFGSYVACCNQDCGINGPNNDPDGAKWNALMRGRVPDAPKDGIVRVRIAAEVDANGKWSASGWSNSTDGEMRQSASNMCETDDTRITLFITADLPLPKPVEVVGRCE